MSVCSSPNGTPGQSPRRTSYVRTSLVRPKQPYKGIAGRWSCEVVNFYTKTQLGLTDFRVQSYEAVDKYMLVVHLAWAYVEYRFAMERSAQIRTYGDIIRRHRDEHAIEWLDGAIQMAIDTGDRQAVIEHFLRLPSSSQ